MKKNNLKNVNLENSIKDYHIYFVFIFFLSIFFRDIIFQKSFFWEDFLYYFYPVRNFATVSFANGEIPLWNPYTFGGMPFQADIQTTTFYLPNFLLVPFVKNGRLDFLWNEIFIITHFLVAGIGMYNLSKKIFVSKLPSAFSGFVYMFSGFAILHIAHQVVIHQFAWFPFIILFFKKMLEENSLKYAMISAFFLSLAILGGHPQFSLYFFYFLFAYFLFELYPFVKNYFLEKSFGNLKNIFWKLVLATSVILFSISFSAIQLLPTFELANLSVREEISFAKSLEGEIFWQQLITVLIPKFFGTSNHLLAENEFRYFGPGLYWSFWETVIYCGIATITLAIFSLKQFKENRLIKFFSIVGIFAILLALGDNFFLHKIFYEFVPGFEKFRSIGRLGFFYMFAVSILSGFGLKEILISKNKTSIIKISIAVTSIVFLVLILLKSNLLNTFLWWQFNNGAFKSGANQSTFSLVFNTSLSHTIESFLFAILSFVAIFFVWKKITSQTFAIVVLFFVHYFDIQSFGFLQTNSKTNTEEHFTQRKNYVDKFVKENESEIFRVSGRYQGSIFIDRNQGMMDKVFLMEGYSPLQLQKIFPPLSNSNESYRIMNTKYRLSLDTVFMNGKLSTGLNFKMDSLVFPRAFFVYNFKEFQTEKEESLFLSSKFFFPKQIATFQEKVDFKIFDTTENTNWKTKILNYKNNSFQVEVETEKDGILILSEIYYPNWKCFVDGKERKIYRTNWSLRSVFVEKGIHKIDFIFEPKPFHLGAKISLVTLLVSFAIVVFDFYKNRKNKK